MNLRQRIILATPIISLMIFLSLGFIWNLWTYAWIAFVLIPIMPVVLGEVSLHCLFPLIVFAIYFATGFGFGIWHPGWIMLLSIPVYYIIFPVKMPSIKEKIQESKQKTYTY